VPSAVVVVLLPVGDDDAGLGQWSDYDRAMLIYSMSVSVDGYIADRDGAFISCIGVLTSFIDARRTRADLSLCLEMN
jgi:hypothetical protein